VLTIGTTAAIGFLFLVLVFFFGENLFYLLVISKMRKKLRFFGGFLLANLKKETLKSLDSILGSSK
jgi:small neutral amino acid transporter SnatA (MarC family)